MKNFNRQDLMFSLCGLNCGLCTMKSDNYCPGCGGGAGNQGCPIARCSLQKGGIEYCYECGEYPCEKYKGIDKFDSFVTHRHQFKDMVKFREIGKEAYHSELKEKIEILKYLLAEFNDGRHKSFFSIAVYLIDLQDIKNITEQIQVKTSSDNFTLKEKASIAAELFRSFAEQRNLTLKLKKKTSRK